MNIIELFKNVATNAAHKHHEARAERADEIKEEALSEGVTIYTIVKTNRHGEQSVSLYLTREKAVERLDHIENMLRSKEKSQVGQRNGFWTYRGDDVVEMCDEQNELRERAELIEQIAQ